MHRLTYACSIALAFGLTLGCRTTEPAQTGGTDLPPAGADQRYEVNLPDPPQPEARRIELDVHESLDGCGLEQAHFPYDKAKALPQDHVELRVIADCLNTPPYDQSGVLLVGSADQRGPADYNEELGLERAEYVKKVLAEYGVAPARIEVSTKGEAKAKGAKPEYSHGYDRRVDVVQLMVHAPY